MTTLSYTPYGALAELFAPIEAYSNGDDAEMIRLGAEWPETLVEGPAGTGKSYGAAIYFDLLCQFFPGCRGLIVRQTLKSLRESVQVTLEQKVWGPYHPCVTSSQAKRQNRGGYLYPENTNVVNGITYSGRSEMVLCGMDNPGRVLSTEFDWVWAEEGFEISLDAWETLSSRNRNWHMPWQQMVNTTNPEGRYNWLNKRPEKKAEDGRPKMRRLRSKHWENPLFWDLDKGTWTPQGEQYVTKKLRNLSGTRRKRLLDGEWVSSEGLIWDSYDEDTHIIDRDKVPEIKWAVGGIDWGFRNPGSLTVWGVDGDERLYCLYEAYYTGKTLEWWAAMCAKANDKCKEEFGCEMRVVIADSAEPRSIDKLNTILRKPNYEGRGYVRSTKHKNQLAQIQMVDLAMRADVEINNGRPAWYIAKDTLMHPPDPILLEQDRPVSLKYEIPAWVWRKAEDGTQIKDEEDPTCDAHACDTARYIADFVLNRDLTAPKVKPKLPKDSFGDLMGHRDILFTD